MMTDAPEELRRENERLRAEVRAYMDAAEAHAVAAMRSSDRAAAAEAALAASRAPDPVVKADRCQPGDLISRATAVEVAASIADRQCPDNMPHDAYMAYHSGAMDVLDAIRALPAAPVAEAQPVARLDGFDTTGQAVQQDRPRVAPGLYKVFWKSGGSSFAAFGCTANGDNWVAPTNWLRPVMLRDIKPGEWGDIDRIAEMTPPQDWARGPDADSGEANARFIAASRDLVPALAAERDAAKAEVARRVEMHECAMQERDDAILHWVETNEKFEKASAEIARLTAERDEARAQVRKLNAIITGNPSGTICDACRGTGLYHCVEAFYGCEGMRGYTIEEATAALSRRDAAMRNEARRQAAKMFGPIVRDAILATLEPEDGE